jgi:hypothetical protein
MPILPFESKEKKRNREMQEVADFIAYEAARNFKYDADNDPVLAEFRRKMGLSHIKNEVNLNCLWKTRRLFFVAYLSLSTAQG